MDYCIIQKVNNQLPNNETIDDLLKRIKLPNTIVGNKMIFTLKYI